MGDMHVFSVEVAKEVGVNAAILLQSIKWWCDKNKANGKHFHDGMYWTYNSVKAWQELYPYLGRGAIDSALKKLEQRGFIVSGNHNKSAYDRTKWYAITELGLSLFGESIYRNEEMEESESGNPNCEDGKPIPVAYTDTNPVTKTVAMGEQMSLGLSKETKAKFVPPTLDEVTAYVREKDYHFDAKQFVDYYEADDWRRKDGTPVTSWKRCCITWERHCADDAPKAGARPDTSEFSEFSRQDAVFGRTE